jgi:hypothetical protein
MTRDMLDFELKELNQSMDWRSVLAAYQSAQDAAKNSEAEFDGWLPRIVSIVGVDDEALPKLHGKLIALGFLKFQLASRESGVVYQISPAGREALNNQMGAMGADDEDAGMSDPEALEDAA